MIDYDEWRRARRHVAGLDRKLRREALQDPARADLRRGIANALVGVAALAVTFTSAYVRSHPLTVAGAALFGIACRFTGFLDMYAMDKLDAGHSNRFITISEKTLRHTPFRYVSDARIASLHARKVHNKYLDELHVKRDLEPEHCDRINEDIASLDKISRFIDPFDNLRPAALSAFGLIAAASIDIIHPIGASNHIPLILAEFGRAATLLATAAYSAAQLGVFTTKCKASGSRKYDLHSFHRNLLESSHDLLMRLPGIRHLSWAILAYEHRKLGHLTISPDLEMFLKNEGLEKELKILNDASHSPAKLQHLEFRSDPAPRRKTGGAGQLVMGS